MAITPDIAEHLSRIALSHVEREFPNKLDHVLAGPDDSRTPRDLHPVFFGSFDWHSCVHSYWLLARLHRLSPGHGASEEARRLFKRRFTSEALDGELAYLSRPESRGFERPYGWAWLLALQAELVRGGGETAGWAELLNPLASAFADRIKAFLPKADYPVRAGTHGNTAFALTLALDYADVAGDGGLAQLVRKTAQRWYGLDRDCQAWEPSGDDFLSPALIEAECMRLVLDRRAFADWLSSFLPRLADREPATLFRPVNVSDRTDGKIAHLDGLNLSRAWCWRSLGRALIKSDPRQAVCENAAELHLAAGLPHLDADYMGQHWLASFAALALEPAFGDADAGNLERE